MQFIPKPFYSCAGNKNTAFQSISYLSVQSPGNGCQQSALRINSTATGIHKHKTTGAIGIFSLSLLKTCLPEQCRLLITGDTRNGYSSGITEKRAVYFCNIS